MADLLQIGSSGVLGHQKMLHTTGNNISNVNTDGYNRQRTLNKSQIDDMGLGREIAATACDVVSIATHKRHELVSRIAKGLQVPGFVHVTVVIGPVQWHCAVYRRHRL